MRTLIIGGTGFIGNHIARTLTRRSHMVASFARDDHGADRLANAGVRRIAGNVEDLADIRRAADDADAIIFCAQLLSQKEEQHTVHKLLEHCDRSGKTFIFTSGSGVLSQPTAGEWSEESFAEDDMFTPLDALAVRAETEKLVRDPKYGNVRAMVIRPPTVWGDGYHGFVDRMLGAIETTGKACYIGTGANLYSSVHVEDLAELYALALEKGTSGALYHAVSGELNNRMIAELVARQQRVRTCSVSMEEAAGIWDYFAVRAVLSVCSRTRCPRSRKELGWRPQQTDLMGAIASGSLISRHRQGRQGNTGVGTIFRNDSPPERDRRDP